MRNFFHSVLYRLARRFMYSTGDGGFEYVVLKRGLFFSYFSSWEYMPWEEDPWLTEFAIHLRHRSKRILYHHLEGGVVGKLTCNQCYADYCEWRGDGYNVDGDCLALK